MEESGWKNVHGDVFRPPQYPMILSSLLGSGIQLFCMVLIVICELVFSVNSSLQSLTMLTYYLLGPCCSSAVIFSQAENTRNALMVLLDSSYINESAIR